MLEDIAVEGVGARLDHHIDDAALEVAELGRGVGGDDLHLLDGVGAGLVGREVIGDLVTVDAVKEEVIGLLAVAVDEGAAAGGIVAGAGIESGWVGGGDAGDEEGELEGVTAD